MNSSGTGSRKSTRTLTMSDEGIASKVCEKTYQDPEGEASEDSDNDDDDDDDEYDGEDSDNDDDDDDDDDESDQKKKKKKMPNPKKKKKSSKSPDDKTGGRVTNLTANPSAEKSARKKSAPKKSAPKKSDKAALKKNQSTRTSARIKRLEKKKAILTKRVAKAQAKTTAAERHLESVQAENTDLQREIDGADGRNDLAEAVHLEFAETLIASLGIDPNGELAALLTSGKRKKDSTGAIYDGDVLPFGEGREFSDAKLARISYDVKRSGGTGKYAGGQGKGESRRLENKAKWENGDCFSPLVTKHLFPRAAELIVSENPKLLQLGRMLGLSLIKVGGEVVGIEMNPSVEGET